jgi:pimeloyl-ACP methyl ester carboxylesterase
MIVRWRVFESGGQQVEAQVWEPAQLTDKCILFCPGFPGAGATVFEQRHAAALADAGYTLVVLRHKGTRLDGPHAPAMVNNASRLSRGGTHIGGGAATIDEWLAEPLTALRVLADQFTHIDIIGNSFGALSSLWSLTRADAPLDNVRRLVLLAGAQGVHEDNGVTDIMRIWRPEFVSAPRITEKVTLNDPHEIVAVIHAAYAELPPKVAALPAHIRMTALVVAKDELLTRVDADKFNAAIGGRCLVIVDEINQPYHAHGLLAHDMPDWRAGDILALLAG